MQPIAIPELATEKPSYGKRVDQPVAAFSPRGECSGSACFPKFSALALGRGRSAMACFIGYGMLQLREVFEAWDVVIERAISLERSARQIEVVIHNLADPGRGI